MMLIPANVSHEDFLKDLYEDEYNDYVEDSARPGAGKSKPAPKLTPEQENALNEHGENTCRVRRLSERSGRSSWLPASSSWSRRL